MATQTNQNRATALSKTPSRGTTTPATMPRTPRPIQATPRRTRGRFRKFPTAQNFYGQNTEQQGQTMGDVAGFFNIQAMKGAQGYDPNNPWAGMSEQGFQNQLDQARTSVMNQFERSMGPQFAREEQQFRQRMAEQGVDPNSGAYQSQYNQMKEAQNAARQGAEAQAFQLGANYQQQKFTQGMQGRMMPFEQAQMMQPMYTIPYQTGMAGQQQQQQRQWEAQQNQLSREAAMAQAQLGARTSMGTAQLGAQTQKDIALMNLINQQYGNYGTQQPDWRNSAIQGFTTGATGGIINAYSK